MRKIEIIVAAIDHIETNLGEPLSLETIADELCYSRYYLHRLFTKTVQLTMHEYIQRRRLTEAAKLLIWSRKPIIDISLKSGYESQQAFSSIFKTMYKLPPHKFRERKEFYPLQMRFEFEEATYKPKTQLTGERTVIFAREEDIPEWMRLVHLVIDGFPCLNEIEHINTLKKYIAQKSAFIMREGDITIGIMMISYITGSIDFFGIHPLYRNQNIIRMLFAKAINELAIYNEISMTTYRKGDKADTGHRKMLEELRFAEGELLVEFGYPTQKMVVLTNTFRETINAF